MEDLFLSRSLATLLIVLQFSTCLAVRPIAGTETDIDFIRTSCNATTYPQLCYTSLSSYTTEIQTSPMLLANSSLTITLAAVRSASSIIAKISKSCHGLKHEEASSAVRDCMEMLGDAVDQLQNSIMEMGQSEGSDFELQMNDILTWVSSALTDEDTCMDGFAGNAMDRNVKTRVRAQIVSVSHLTSNALALVNAYASKTTSP